MHPVTPDEIERAKRWASVQTTPVTCEHDDYTHMPMLVLTPEWLNDDFDRVQRTAEDCWSALALALRPVFASVGPIVEAEILSMSLDDYADRYAKFHARNEPNYGGMGVPS